MVGPAFTNMDPEFTDPLRMALVPAVAGDDRLHGITDLRHHTARGVLVNGLFQLGLIGVSALRGIVVAVFLTRADYGVWGIVGLTFWTAVSFKSIFGANDKFIQQSEINQEHAFQRAFTVELIFAAAIVPVTAVIVVTVAALTGHGSVVAPGLTLLLMLPATALQFPLAVFFRRMEYRRQRTLAAIEPLGGAVVMVAAAVAGAGYWSFVIGSLFGSWAAAAVALRACPYKIRWRYDRRTLVSYLGFSFSLLLTGISGLVVFYVVILAGSGPLGLAGLGAFTLVGNLVQFTDQADAMITETLYPAICVVSDRLRLLAEVFIKSNRLSLMWAVPFGVGLSLFGSDLIRFVLGVHWLPALPLLEIMGVVTAVNHVGYNWSTFYKARGTTWPMAVSAVVVSGVVIATAIPLMRSDHLAGLGWAFAIGQVVSLLVRGYFAARLFGGVSLITHLVRAFAPTAVAVAPILAFRSIDGLERSLAVGLALFALYAVLTVGATAGFERPLLREATTYFMRKRTAAVV